MPSTTIIITAANLGASRDLAADNGAGPDCFSVPLSATGTAPATHYGMHQWQRDEWMDGLAHPVSIVTGGDTVGFWEVASGLGLQPIESI